MRKEEHAVMCYFPFHLSLAPYRTNQRSPLCFSRTVSLNGHNELLLPPPLAGISKLPSSWTQVTEDSLLQKNVVSRKLAVLSSVLNK